jgi:hypothetical protein
MRPAQRIAVLAAIFAAGLGLSACADNYLTVDGAGHHTAEPPKLSASQASTPSPVAVRTDTCGAAPLQYLVGKPKSEVPVPVDPSKRRVYCSTCTVTMDYRPGRLDVVFDQDTGLVTAIKCG